MPGRGGAGGDCGLLMGCPMGSERWKEEILRVRKGEREGMGEWDTGPQGRELCP